MKNIFYVYALLDPRKEGPYTYGKWKFSHEPFYIGKGKGKRCTAHTSKSERKYNPHKERIIAKLHRLQLEPVIVIKRKGLLDADALELEKKLIEAVGRNKLTT